MNANEYEWLATLKLPRIDKHVVHDEKERIDRQKKKRYALSVRQSLFGGLAILIMNIESTRKPHGDLGVASQGSILGVVSPLGRERYNVIQRILQLRSLSTPIGQIAQECGLTVGQVKYQLHKHKLGSSTVTISDDQPVTMGEPSVPINTEDNKDTVKRTWQQPSFYAKNIVKVMVQSPHVLFVYWEITWPRMRMVASYLQTDYRSIEKGLRLYDVTERFFDGANAHSHRDIHLSEEVASWYINDVQPNRTYIVDFGLFHMGFFCPILRSEPIVTPCNQAAVWGEPLIEQATDTRYPAWFENFSSYTVYSK